MQKDLAEKIFTLKVGKVADVDMFFRLKFSHVENKNLFFLMKYKIMDITKALKMILLKMDELIIY